MLPFNSQNTLLKLSFGIRKLSIKCGPKLNSERKTLTNFGTVYGYFGVHNH